MSRADGVVLAALGLLVVGLWLAVWAPGGRAGAAIITGPDGSLSVSLTRNRLLTVHGPLGDTTLRVEDGRIRFVNSPCPHKVCIRSGWHARSGAVAACVPNRISLRLTGGDDDSLDGLSQ